MKSRRELVFGAAGVGVGALMAATAAQARTLSASASPTIVDVTDSSYSAPVTVTVSGGVAPYSYLWTQVSGSTNIMISDPTSPVVEFGWVGPFNGPPRLSGWVCHVTDGANETASTGVVRAAYSS
ncbi:hypothetical protein [Caulobacter sp. RHG1]|uniref:hypothetical protein n=1 Tax=Caulobacter sp. (strain RHG1) TaxID=2545762 RepID=UPI001555A0C3|nr:hypothetical protein [Caulobacter sp. RHG1]NQE64631.1 hypothetical protein [Caulobacter sp. RHG1]